MDITRLLLILFRELELVPMKYSCTESHRSARQKASLLCFG